jgi:hypothetical protein
MFEIVEAWSKPKGNNKRSFNAATFSLLKKISNAQVLIAFELHFF